MSVRLGQQFITHKQITERDILLFAEISGDRNPLHLNDEFARKSLFKQRVAHGMLTASLISATLSSIPGTIILTYECLDFERPVYIGDFVAAKATITTIEGSRLSLDVEVIKENDGTRVVSGIVKILKK